MKKFPAAVIAAALLLGIFGTNAFAAVTPGKSGDTEISFVEQDSDPKLYAHALTGSTDSEAWVGWQAQHDDDLFTVNDSERYFFLPSSADESKVDLYNASKKSVTVNGVEIAPYSAETVTYDLGAAYPVSFDGSTYTVSFMRSTAEAAIFVNNNNADGNGTDLMSYLWYDKSISAKATGAIVNKDGTIDNTDIKKIKGRGNTTWDKTKKPFNITYDSKVSIGGMSEGKKYSLLANYQDDSLSRNRILYDLSDAVGMPYASDSRYVDFYVNGNYWGSYQATEKIETGKSSVVNDIGDSDYLNEDGTVKADFPFVCEIDASAGSDDYTVNVNGTKLTIKSPELSPGDPGYDEVKKYVSSKFKGFQYACANPQNRDLSEFADIDSVTKLYLINELGKNWDSGVSSTFFTYKQDKDCVYKFFGSPVWDYDNSLGNAVGVGDDLRRFGVSDYTKYTGWWCQYKGRRSGSKTTDNILANIAVNDYVQKAAPRIWFEDFVPAIEHFTGKNYSETIDKELYTAEEYRALIKGSAEMNYKSGWLLNTGAWIADHSKLTDNSGVTHKYGNTFDGMYDYCVDWLTFRAEWISANIGEYVPEENDNISGDIDGNGTLDSADALMILRASLGLQNLGDKERKNADVNGDGTVDSGDALIVLRRAVGLSD